MIKVNTGQTTFKKKEVDTKKYRASLWEAKTTGLSHVAKQEAAKGRDLCSQEEKSRLKKKTYTNSNSCIHSNFILAKHARPGLCVPSSCSLSASQMASSQAVVPELRSDRETCLKAARPQHARGISQDKRDTWQAGPHHPNMTDAGPESYRSKPGWFLSQMHFKGQGL